MIKKNKIYIICDNTHTDNGWGTYANNLIKQINNDKLVIICRKKNSSIRNHQINILSEPDEYFKNPFLIIKDSFKLLKILEKNSIIHIMVEPYLMLIPFIGTKSFKIIVTFHGSYFLKLIKSKLKFVFKLGLQKCSQFIFVSNYTKKKLIPYLKNFNRVEKKVIKNAILADKFYIKKNFKKVKILCLSAFKKRKGQLNLVKFADYLNKKNKKFKLTFAGKVYENNYFQIIKKKTKELNLSKKIFYKLNPTELQKKNLFQKHNLFILLSEDDRDTFEGFGLVYLEALSFGMPIVVSKKTGATDIDLMKGSGVKVNNDDFDKISNFIENLKKSNFLKVSENCIKTCQKNIWSRRSKQIKNLY